MQLVLRLQPKLGGIATGLAARYGNCLSRWRAGAGYHGAHAARKYVDTVMTDTPVRVTKEFMQQHGFDIYTFACASEQERLEKYKLCESLPAEMIQELTYTSGISTSDLVMRILEGAGSKEAVITNK